MQEVARWGTPQQFNPRVTWPAIRSEVAALRVPDEQMQFLYDAAVHTLVLLSADEIVPGPYTYRRFWFRDACLMMNSLLAIGLTRPLPAGDRAVSRAATAQRLFPLARGRMGFQRPGAVDSRPLRAADGRAAVRRGAGDRCRKAVDVDRSQADAEPTATRCTPGCCRRVQRRTLGPQRLLLLGRLLGRGGPAGRGRIYDRLGRQRATPPTPARRPTTCAASIDRSIHRIPAGGR